PAPKNHSVCLISRNFGSVMIAPRKRIPSQNNAPVRIYARLRISTCIPENPIPMRPECIGGSTLHSSSEPSFSCPSRFICSRTIAQVETRAHIRASQRTHSLDEHESRQLISTKRRSLRDKGTSPDRSTPDHCHDRPVRLGLSQFGAWPSCANLWFDDFVRERLRQRRQTQTVAHSHAGAGIRTGRSGRHVDQQRQW